MNFLQYRICLWVFDNGACRFDIKIFEQWNVVTLEFRAIAEDNFARSRIS